MWYVAMYNLAITFFGSSNYRTGLEEWLEF